MRNFFLFFILIAFSVSAQRTYDFVPKNYHLMTPEEKAKLVSPYVGVTFLMEDGKYLENKDVAAMKANGGYEQLYYGDSTGNVRIIVSRKLTEAEIQKRKDDYSKFKLESSEKLTQLVGQPFPEIGMTNMDGTAFSVAGSDKPTVLYFWFSNCPECEKVLPEFNKLYNLYKDKFNFASPTLDKKNLAETFANQHVIHNPKLVSGVELKNKHINFFPTVILLDKEGNVLSVQQPTDLIENLKVKLYELSKLK